MLHLNYSVYLIQSPKDLEQLDREVAEEKQYKENYLGSIEKMWEEAFNFLRPGQSQDNTMALVSKIKIPGRGDLEEEIGKKFVPISEEIYKERNVLSVSTKIERNDDEESLIVTVVVLPIPKRAVSAKEYINEHTRQIKDDLKAKYEQAIADIIPDVFITGLTYESKTAEELGYKPALLEYKPIKYEKAFDTEIIYPVQENLSTEMAPDKIRGISNELISRFKTGVDSLVFERAQTGEVSKREVKGMADEYLKSHGYGTSILSANDHKVVLDRFYSAMYGNYILDPLIADDKISDIMILEPNRIRVKAQGKRYTTNVKFLSADDYIKFCDGIAIRNNLDIRHEDVHVFSDPYSSKDAYLRLNLTTARVNTNGFPAFQIRKIAKNKRDWDYLLNAGMLDETLMYYLIDRARTARGIIFCGKGASGKTTLMNTMLDCIPFNKSVEVMQESIELFTKVHPHIDFKQISKKNPLEVLARNGLLTDLDYYIIGETKGKEAKYLAMAVDSGHKGWTSVHASNAREGMIRLTDYVMMGTDYSQEQAIKQLLNMDTLIYMQDFKVCEIYQIKGWDKNKKEVIFEPVYIRPGMQILSAL